MRSLWGEWCGSGNGAAGVSGVFGTRGAESGPGILRAFGAMFAVRGRGDGGGETLFWVRGRWQGEEEQAGHGEDPGGGQGGDEDPGPRQGERRAEGRSGGGLVRGHARHGSPPVRAAGRRLRGGGAGQLRGGGVGGGDRGPEAAWL